ncbi:MAG: response regulator, partial [Desulfobacterales bacterium]
FIVDDDPDIIKILAKFLETEGFIVSHSTSSVSALPEIIQQKPDCVLLDIMMPEMDGLELCKQLRSDRGLDVMKIVMVSAKAYESDRKRAISFGADGYIIKPVEREKFIDQLQRIIEGQIELNFWGVHGTLPVSGEETVKYGGNTSCVSLEFPKGNFFIFDAGSGIKVLSDHLMADTRTGMEAKIFISHPHWDHINALPFFTPLYIPGREFEICGPSHGDINMHDMVSAQMDGVYFPITIKEFGARVYFRDLKEEAFEMEGIKIKTLLLNHPGQCLGYRVEYNTRTICYITDNELYPKSSQFYSEEYLNKLTDFVMNTDVLITDSTYTDEEYERKIGWGHSSVGQVVDLADRAGVKTLYLFHHDPDQKDADIDKKLEAAQAMLKKRKSATRCVAPKERQPLKI